MRAEVLRWCRQEQLFAPGDRVICAVSGGADSMAMLWCLHSLQSELSITVSAAHFNHRLRGAESDRDESFVRDFCESHGITLVRGAADPGDYGDSALEETARHLRYAFFETLDCDKLATAHTADDNTETVLLHLLRGTGLRGLCGIPPQRDRFVRPLLSVTREQLVAYLTEHGIRWVEDSTNSHDDCRRNRLRHGVVPLLREETPTLSRRITEQTRLLRGEDALLDDLARDLLNRAHTERGWNCETLLSAPDALQKRALRVLLRDFIPQDVSFAQIEGVQKLLSASSPSAQISVHGGLTVRRVYEDITISREEQVSFVPVALEVGSVTRIPELGLDVTCTFEENFKKSVNTPFHFAVKYDMIRQHIIFLRPRQKGDRITLPGGHTVSLKKLFIDRKIPRAERERIPVLARDEKVLGVAGFGADLNCRPAAGESAIIIRLEKEEM